jgi:hypothetical protein
VKEASAASALAVERGFCMPECAAAVMEESLLTLVYRCAGTRVCPCRRFRNPKLERVPREQQFRRVIDICKRVKLCHHCGAYNGTVK